MKEAVIFDVDNTILEGFSQAFLFKYLYKKGYVSFYVYVRLTIWIISYQLGIAKNPKPAMEYGLVFIKNHKVSEGEAIVEDFFNTILIKKIYPDAINSIREHQAKGRNVILVSNAPDILVVKLAKYFSIFKYFATRLEQKDGIYTGKIIGEIMYSKQKLNTVNSYLQSENILLGNTWAYGDHISDSYLLSEVGHPFAVNPSNGLEKDCNKK